MKMKVVLFVLFIAGVVWGTTLGEKPLAKGEHSKIDYYEVTIDSCQYIVIQCLGINDNGCSIVHKMNCSNLMHRK